MTSAPAINDCFVHDRDRLRHDEALEILRANLECVVGTEDVALADCPGRILAENVTAPQNVPLHTNAAVDGYAFAHSDLIDQPLPVSKRIAAGDADPDPLAPNTVARIFTGATMPQGADTVAMQEDCTADGGSVLLPAGLKAGANCRKAGEDLAEGATLLTASSRLNAADIAAAASVGRAKLKVRSKLSIVTFASGNELRRAETNDEMLKIGQVWDANSVLLRALLSKLPVTIDDGGILPDRRNAVQSALEDAATRSDVILTTGGASRGEEDHVLAALDSLGKRHLWQLAVKPGRPMMMGQIPRSVGHDCLFMGLPGNPVAAMVCFLLYVRPALLQLAGASPTVPIRYPLPAAFDIKSKKPDRREFLRGILVERDGVAMIDKFARDGSGLISSLRESDGLIEIPEEVTSVQRGEMVSFIPYHAFD